MKDYVIKIGIEVHAELKTQTKAFCGCRNEFGAIPNTLVCPVCLGLPGSIPSINRRAVECVIATGLLFESDISELTMFERKNFFYPDRPKGYQLVQYSMPICKGGRVELENGKEIVLNRIHLEEDSAKLIHNDNMTLIDFNRSGVPLVEIVASPAELNSDEVVEYLNKLKRTLIFSGVSDCNSSEGGFRFDINISMCPVGEDIGTRVELINLSSSKDVKGAIEYEIERQRSVLESGDKVLQETRVWSEEFGKTYVIRPKENVSDYRHVADPDLKTIRISTEDIARIKKALPETVPARRNRYAHLGLNQEQIDILVSEKYISDYFDDVMKRVSAPQDIAHYMLTEIMHVFKSQHQFGFDTIISAENLATIITLKNSGKISSINAKVLFDEVVATGKNADSLAKELEIVGKVSDNEILDVVDEILDGNMDIISDFHNNPEGVMNYFIGKVKSMTGGRADAETVQTLTIDKIKKK